MYVDSYVQDDIPLILKNVRDEQGADQRDMDTATSVGVSLVLVNGLEVISFRFGNAINELDDNNGLPWGDLRSDLKTHSDYGYGMRHYSEMPEDLVNSGCEIWFAADDLKKLRETKSITSERDEEIKNWRLWIKKNWFIVGAIAAELPNEKGLNRENYNWIENGPVDKMLCLTPEQNIAELEIYRGKGLTVLEL